MSSIRLLSSTHLDIINVDLDELTAFLPLHAFYYLPPSTLSDRRPTASRQGVFNHEITRSDCLECDYLNNRSKTYIICKILDGHLNIPKFVQKMQTNNKGNSEAKSQVMYKKSSHITGFR